MKANMPADRIISFTTRLPADPNHQVTPGQQNVVGDFFVVDSQIPTFDYLFSGRATGHLKLEAARKLFFTC
jgi:hypothetical protein